jgi:hypothetical protein
MIFSGTNGSCSAFWGLVNLNPQQCSNSKALDIKTQSENVHFPVLAQVYTAMYAHRFVFKSAVCTLFVMLV